MKKKTEKNKQAVRILKYPKINNK